MPSLGLGLTLGRSNGSGSSLDADATAWFEAVEATGATFGPDSATVSANKAAWSDWVVAQKNAESPIEGRSNWQQLTQADEGFIQPLMGVSTFNVPPIFGGRTFTGFVSGDYDPAIGLRGGEDRIITSDRTWNDTPDYDVSAGVILTGPPITTASNGRIVGADAADVFRELFNNDGSVRLRSPAFDDTTTLFEASTPRTVAMSRHTETGCQVFNGSIYVISRDATSASANSVAFLNDVQLNRESDARIGVAFYGRSIDVEAMNAANIALSEAIVWP